MHNKSQLAVAILDESLHTYIIAKKLLMCSTARLRLFKRLYLVLRGQMLHRFVLNTAEGASHADLEIQFQDEN